MTTWYVDGVYVPFNDEQRRVLLGYDFTTWIADMRRVWHDLEDASADIDFALVQPAPPCSPLNTVHVLLFQQVDMHQVGVVATKYDNAVRQGAPYSAAIAIANPVRRRQVIESFGKIEDCRPPVHCGVWNEQTEITPEGRELQHGNLVQLHIHRPVLNSWDEEEEENDETNYMQSSQMQGAHHLQGTSEAPWTPEQSACSSFQFNAAALEFVPSRPPISALPEHLQDLHGLWEQHASVNEGEERKSSVQTWFLSPGRQRLRCGYCRKVHLYDDYMKWEDTMQQAWADEIRSDQPVFFFVVQPTPVALAPDIAAHVLIVQDLTAHQVASLVTIFDVAMHQGHPFRIAIVTHEHITREEILERIGYTAEVARLGPLIQCTFRHGLFTMPIGRAVPRKRRGPHCFHGLTQPH